jgi:hypothetical protein
VSRLVVEVTCSTRYSVTHCSLVNMLQRFREFRCLFYLQGNGWMQQFLRRFGYLPRGVTCQEIRSGGSFAFRVPRGMQITPFWRQGLALSVGTNKSSLLLEDADSLVSKMLSQIKLGRLVMSRNFITVSTYHCHALFFSLFLSFHQ